ncbi:MAG TPA: ABC transporter substrate-binding protein [Candidatus Binatus sp.]|nr:ABC transporter substrate-binding protein [Candidatus Binatus sp.]
MNHFIVAASVTFFSLPLLSCESAAQTDNIRVYFYPPWNISKLPMYMAHDAGIFEREGLKLLWTNPGSNEKLLAALKHGDADIAVVSANHVAQNNASGGPALKLVGNTGYNYSAFFAAASIKNAADLKGKKIGSGEPGSTPDQLTRLALRKLGIDPDKDVTLVHFDEGRNSDRVKNLLNGDIAAMIITAEAIYDLEKSGEIKRLNRLADHKQLKIYAGGGADYAMSATFLKNRREDAKKFMSGICAGIALARNDKTTALSFVAKSGRNLDAATIDYLYRLYIAEVIPARPFLKPEGIELAILMTAALFPNAAPLQATELIDASLIPELEKSGRCNN